MKILKTEDRRSGVTCGWDLAQSRKNRNWLTAVIIIRATG